MSASLLVRFEAGKSENVENGRRDWKTLPLSGEGRAVV